jgi:hypothetical protein
MFAAVAAGSPATRIRPGRYISPRKPKMSVRSIATPAMRA